MKITMYELLGMVKDGKAPKKVKWRDRIWTFNNYNQDYEKNTNDCLLSYGFCNHRTLDFLNDEVEIIEEEKKIPNKWEEPAIKGMKSSNSFEELVPYIETIMRTQNDILDYLNSKGE